jgi:AraC-like DNA-binding protein
MTTEALLEEIRDRIAAHARRDPRSRIDGFLVSRAEGSEPDYELTDPLVVVMAQGGKRLYLDQEVVEYGAGDCLVVTTSLPLSGHFLEASRERPALAIGLRLRPERVAPLVARLRRTRAATSDLAVATCPADEGLLDAVARMLRLLDPPYGDADREVLAPLIERELLWRLLTGPLGTTVAQIGLDDSALVHVSRAISWIRGHLAEPMAVPQLAALAGMSTATFHRHFRGVTGMTPLQYQKHLRLQEARALLVARAHDVTTVGELVGYHSPTQFNREYRRLFGVPPGRDAARLREAARQLSRPATDPA